MGCFLSQNNTGNQYCKVLPSYLTKEETDVTMNSSGSFIVLRLLSLTNEMQQLKAKAGCDYLLLLCMPSLLCCCLTILIIN